MIQFPFMELLQRKSGKSLIFRQNMLSLMLSMWMAHILGRCYRRCINMKKGALIFCLTLALPMILFCMTACQHDTADTPDVLSPAIMIDGVVYYSLGKELDAAPLEKSYSGHVTSVVSVKDLPTQNGEANVPCLDAPYVIVGEGVAVLFNEKWILFEQLDN